MLRSSGGSGCPPKTSVFTAPEPLRGFEHTVFTAPEAFGAPGTLRKHRYLPLRSHFEASKIRYLPIRTPAGLWLPSENIEFTTPEPLRGFRNTLFTAPDAFGTLETFRKRRYLLLQSLFEASKIPYLPLLWFSGLWIPSEDIGVYHSAATTTLSKYTIYRSGAI